MNSELKVNANHIKLYHQSIKSGRADFVATVVLDRADTANALNKNMIQQLTQIFHNLGRDEHCRMVCITGDGKHFSAGADLQWMKDSANLSYAANVEDAEGLLQMFKALAQIPCPTLALAHGMIYGGAVGLVAVCDIAIADTQAKFCLSEIRLGLLPAIILPYLARRMHDGALRRLALLATPFAADEAQRVGLIDRICTKNEMPNVVTQYLQDTVKCSREAQGRFKTLLDELRNIGFQQSPITAEAIAEARTSKSGQSGLHAFFKKELPPWSLDIESSWRLEHWPQ